MTVSAGHGTLFVMKIVFSCLVFMLMLPTLVHADIFRYVDDNGVVCYTDAPFGKKTETVLRERKSEPDAVQYIKPASVKSDYSHYIHKAAAKHDLEPELIKAVIKTESNGNHRAVSRKGAMGLMQLMPSTANDMDVSNPFDPEENIEGGTRYLKYLLGKFNGNLSLALAAYNSGPKTVEKYGSVPPITETKQYVNRVFSLYNGKRSYDLSSPSAPAVQEKSTPIYKVVLEDGTILFTNSSFLKSGKTRS